MKLSIGLVHLLCLPIAVHSSRGALPNGRSKMAYEQEFWGRWEREFISSFDDSETAVKPTPSPTRSPSAKPSSSPTVTASSTPTGEPSAHPSSKPSYSAAPTASSAPTDSPAPTVTASPTISAAPSQSSAPTTTPQPTTSASPTASPKPSVSPSAAPSSKPTISAAPSQSSAPTTSASPTASPKPSVSPSAAPSSKPTISAAPSQSSAPTTSASPTASPKPSVSPSVAPSSKPTVSAAPSQSSAPTTTPQPTTSASPTASPKPSVSPSASPSTSTCSVLTEVNCVDEDNEPCNFSNPSGEKCIGGNAQELRFIYDAASTCVGNNTQSDFLCVDEIITDRPTTVYVKAFGDATFFEGIVSEGNVFSVFIPSGSTSMDVEIRTLTDDFRAGDLLQTMTMSVQCRDEDALVLLDTFGGLQLVGFRNEEEGLKSVYTDITIEYTVENLGDRDLYITSASKTSPMTGELSLLYGTDKILSPPGDTRVFSDILTLNLGAIVERQGLDFTLDVKGEDGRTGLECEDIDTYTLLVTEA